MSKGNVVILGLGMQGQAALYDLVSNTDASRIIVADNRPDMASDLKRYPKERVSYRQIDATSETQLESVMRGADVVVEALPGLFALPVGRIAAKLGASLVSSMYYVNPGEQDAERIQKMNDEIRRIDAEAKKKGITILTEFGLDPGIDLVLGAQALKELDEVEEFHSYGTGLPAPENADNPLKYKFSWSVIGVMRAYMRPAWIIKNGRVKEIAAREMFALENRHTIEPDEIPVPMECYPNGNSAHYAEVFGLLGKVKEMGRYACRYPGHCDFWEKMAKCGFLDEKPIPVGSMNISPAAFTASLLESQKQFQYSEDERDFTMVRIDVRGISRGKKKRIVYQLIDWRDMDTGFTAMQRTVGFTMGLGARLILEGKLNPGLLSPMDVPYELVVGGLETFGMKITRREMGWE